jgi:hypothetical protein
VPTRGRTAFLIFAVGCAQAGKPDQIAVADGPDGKTYMDAPEQHHDSGSGSGSGSGSCTPMEIEQLTNPAFDVEPEGTGWTQMPINPTYPIVTTDDGIAEQSPTEKAWMGGIVSGSDSLYEQFTIPATATALVLTGYYEVRTAETGATVYDRGSINLTQQNGTTIIEPVLALDNAHPTTSWTAINHTFTNVSAGQTVRLLFATTNDVSNETSFYFDTLSLKAMACP